MRPVAFTADGAIYCPDCAPSGSCADFDDDATYGATCDSCGACYVPNGIRGADWLPHDDAVAPSVRWFRCTACNGMRPVGPEGYRAMRRAFRAAGEKACPHCGRGRMLAE